MGLLTFSLNVTLDGCVDHREGIADDETHAYFTRLMDESGAMLWGRVTYEMMESYWPAVARGDVEAPPPMREWAVKLEAKPKYVVSSTREDFPWTNSHRMVGDLRAGVQELKDATPAGVLVGSGTLANELDRLDLIDEYKFLVHPRIAGKGPTLHESGLPSTRRLEFVSASPFRNGAVALHYRRAVTQTNASQRVGTARRPSRALVATTALALALMLTGCPNHRPPPDQIDIDTDPRALRGTFAGQVETRSAPYLMAIAGKASRLAASWRSSVEVWDLATMDLALTIPLPAAEQDVRTSMSLDSSGSLLAVARVGNAYVWNVADGTLVLAFDLGKRFEPCDDDYHCGVRLVSLHPGGGLVAVAGTGPDVLVVDTSSGVIVRELDSKGFEVSLVAFSSDGTLLVTATRDARDSYGYVVRVWETSEFEIVFEHERPTGFPQFAASADGRHIAMSFGSRVEVVDIDGKVDEFSIDETVHAGLGALSPDGSLVALYRGGAFDSFVSLVDVATGEEVQRFTETQWVKPAWSSDGSILLAGSKVIRTSDWETLRHVVTGKLHELVLVSTARYVHPYYYAISGTMTIDDGDPLEFIGQVHGAESQRYVRPQAQWLYPAFFWISLGELHPWYFNATHAQSETGDPGAWQGLVSDLSMSYPYVRYPFRLWRIDD